MNNEEEWDTGLDLHIDISRTECKEHQDQACLRNKSFVVEHLNILHVILK